MWTKPDELLTPDERAEKSSRWRAVTRPTDGRVYYVHADTKETTWTLPQALADARAKERTAAAAAAAAAATGPLPVPTSRAAASAAFGAALTAAGVPPDSSWEAARGAVAGHVAFAALHTEAARRAAFDAWALAARTAAVEARKKEAEHKKKQAIEDAVAAIERCAGLGAAAPPPRLPASAADDVVVAAGGEAVTSLSAADRAAAINSWRSRAREREQAGAAAARAAAAGPLATLYSSHPGVRRGTPWRDAVAALTGDPAFEAASPAVRLSIFIDHQKSLKAKAAPDDAAADAAAFRAERRVRDAFRELLKAAVADGRLTPRLRWREFRRAIEGEPALAALDAAPRGARAAELFLDAIDALDAAYDGDRSALLAAAKAAGIDAAKAASADGSAALDAAATAAGGAAAAAPAATRALVLAELAAARGRDARRRRRSASEASRSPKRRRAGDGSGSEPEDGQL